MKTRVLVHGAGYSIGGIETYVHNMATHMSVNIIFDYVMETDEKQSNDRMPGNGDTLFIKPKRKMLHNLIDWYKLLEARKEINSTVYFNWYSMAWLFPAIIARFKGYRVIIHAHNNNLHDSGMLQRIIHNICRQIQKFMTITRLTNSDLSAKFFFDNKPAEMIYCAIDTQEFAFNESTRNKLRKELNLEDKHVYGFAGRIAYQKNPLFLMDVFKEINIIDKNAFFLVCGDGDLMEVTRARAKENGIKVKFLGMVTNLKDYYQAMDVFILPSRFEGLGIVLVEAQCNGLPVVASADVIPKDVKVTDLVKFVRLDSGVMCWASECIKCVQAFNERNKYWVKLQATRYNIKSEASKLESILLKRNPI